MPVPRPHPPRPFVPPARESHSLLCNDAGREDAWLAMKGSAVILVFRCSRILEPAMTSSSSGCEHACQVTHFLGISLCTVRCMCVHHVFRTECIYNVS